MAITITHLATNITSVDNTAAVTGSITPSGVVFAYCSMANNLGTPTTAFTMGGTLSASWVKVGEIGVWGSRRYSALYVSTNATGSGTVSAAGQIGEGGFITATGVMVCQITGLDATTPYGTAVTTNGVGTSTNPTAGGTPDGVYSASSVESNISVSFDSTNFTQLDQGGESDGIRRMTTLGSTNGDTTPAYSWSGTNSFGAISVPLNASGAAATSLAANTRLTQIAHLLRR